MSLINQMLRDLQARQAENKTGAIPPLKDAAVVSRRLPLPVFLVILGGCGALLLWWLAGVMTGGPTSDTGLSTQSSAVLVPPQSLAAPENAIVRENEETAMPVPATELNGLAETSRSAVPTEDATTSTAPELVPTTGPAVLAESSRPAVAPTVDAAAREEDNFPASALEKGGAALVESPRSAVRPDLSSHAAVPAENANGRTAASRTGRVLPESLPGAVTGRPAEGAGQGVYATAEQGFQAAQGFYRQNRELSAMAALELTLRQDPGHLAARAFLADLYEMAGRFDEAVVLLKQGMAIVPSHLAFRKRAASLLADQGAYEDAAAVLLHDGLPKISQVPEIHALLAGYYMQLNEPFLAAQTYRNLLAVWPKVGSFWAGLGSALEAQGLNDDARVAFLQAMAAGDLPDELAKVVAGKLQD